MTIQRTITGDTPASVTLTAMLRADSGAAVTLSPALPQPFTTTGGGVYTFTFAPPVDGIGYEYTFVVTWGDSSTDTGHGSIAATGSDDTSYLDVAGADAIAAELLSSTIAAYTGATGTDKLAALRLATLDVDRGMRFQGRKFDSSQTREFPRVAYETAGRVMPHGIIDLVLPPAMTDNVWDWDTVDQVAIVPSIVLQAVVYQANWILDGSEEATLAAINSGLKSQQNNQLAESYDRTAPGATSGLCRRAALLLDRYKLVSGRFV